MVERRNGTKRRYLCGRTDTQPSCCQLVSACRLRRGGVMMSLAEERSDRLNTCRKNSLVFTLLTVGLSLTKTILSGSETPVHVDEGSIRWDLMSVWTWPDSHAEGQQRGLHTRLTVNTCNTDFFDWGGPRAHMHNGTSYIYYCVRSSTSTSITN